jgi:hypothetical protein
MCVGRLSGDLSFGRRLMRRIGRVAGKTENSTANAKGRLCHPWPHSPSQMAPSGSIMDFSTAIGY